MENISFRRGFLQGVKVFEVFSADLGRFMFELLTVDGDRVVSFIISNDIVDPIVANG